MRQHVIPGGTSFANTLDSVASALSSTLPQVNSRALAPSHIHARPVQCLVFVCSISSSVKNNSFQASGQVGICVSLGIYFPANLLIFQYIMYIIIYGGLFSLESLGSLAFGVEARLGGAGQVTLNHSLSGHNPPVMSTW